jgi:bifunctional non-homologous end joining protein LigD
MSESIRNISLYFQEGTSDKEYHVRLTKSGGMYSVNVQYGRRGSTLSAGNKASDVSLEEAEKVYAKVVAEKTKKGYHE